MADWNPDFDAISFPSQSGELAPPRIIFHGDRSSRYSADGAPPPPVPRRSRSPSPSPARVQTPTISGSIDDALALVPLNGSEPFSTVAVPQVAPRLPASLPSSLPSSSSTTATANATVVGPSQGVKIGPLDLTIDDKIFPDMEKATDQLRKELCIDIFYKMHHNSPYKKEKTELHNVVESANIQRLEELLNNNKDLDPNDQDRRGFTPLHYAVKNRSLEAVMFLMRHPKIDLNIQDYKGSSPLHLACHISEKKPYSEKEYKAQQQICLTLIEDARINLNLKDKKGRTPLIISVVTKNIQVFAILLSHNVDTYLSDNDGLNALHHACKLGLRNCVDVLLANGVNIEAKDKNGARAVHFAAENEDLNLLIHMKGLGAQLNVADNFGRTPHSISKQNEVKWFIEERFTCRTHPLQVDFVSLPLLGKCKIGMSMCPGRNKKNWRRNLDVDFSVLVNLGVQTVMSLVREDEWISMGIPHFREALRALGIESLHFPIVDKWIPSSMDELVNETNQLVERIKQEKIILVHCNGGKGRTGLLVVCALVALGMEVGDAVQTIREARPGMIQNPAQLIYAKAFKKVYSQRYK